METKIDWKNNRVQKLTTYLDLRGTMCPIDLDIFPFTPKRLFYIKDVGLNKVRGDHGRFHTQQILICITGCIKIDVFDGKNDECSNFLREDCAIYIPKLTWTKYHFIEKNSIMLALASTEYYLNDYITDKKYFLELCRK